MAYPPGFLPPTPYKVPVLPVPRTPLTPLPGEAGNPMFTRRLPKDAHSIRGLQLGLGVKVDGKMGPQTRTAYVGRMGQRDQLATQGFQADADQAAGAQFAPTSDRTREAAVAETLGLKPPTTPGAASPTPVNTIPSAAVADGTVAPPPLQSFMQKAGSAAKSVGTTIKDHPMEAIAGVQGVLGAISYATAKKPDPLSAPDPYKPSIRGAQGMEATSYEQARQDILTGQEMASQPGTTDAATGVIQKLLASREANKAFTGLAVQNNGAFQQDQRRVDSETTAAYDKNYGLQRGFKEGQYNEQKREYEARRLQSAAQVQGAVDSIGAAYQSSQQDKQLKLESTNRQAESSIKQIHADLASATSDEEVKLLLGKLQKLDPGNLRTEQATVRYGKKFTTVAPPKGARGLKLAAGGAIPTGFVEFKTGKGPKASASTKAKGKGRAGADSLATSQKAYHDMSKDFSNQIARFGAQANQHFQRSLSAAMRLRSTPYASPPRNAR